MANTPISGLPLATVFDGTELLPVVQGGVTKAAATSQFLSPSGPTFNVPVTVDSGINTDGAFVVKGGVNGPHKATFSMQLNSGTQVVTLTVNDDGGFGGALVVKVTPAGGAPTQVARFDHNGTTPYLEVDGQLQMIRNTMLWYTGDTNTRLGTATLVGGTVTVSNNLITAKTRVFLTVQSLGTVTSPKAMAVTARVNGTSFTITSADNTDTSTVAWFMVEGTT